MSSIILRRCLFYYLRLFILIFLCLWFVIILFDRLLLGTDSPMQSAFPLYTPCSLVNDTTRCYPNSSAHHTTDFAPFVELRPYHLNSIQLGLFWTPYFSADALTKKGNSFFHVIFGAEGGDQSVFYRPKQCYREYPRCLFSTNRALYPVAKSVIFHWRDLNTNDLPPAEARSSSQLWTLYNLEAPPHTKRLPEDNYLLNFNLTASYRSDSHIVIPYGRIVHKRRMNTVFGDDVKSKSKQVAWFVSNCQTTSHREDYVKQLARYIQVDVYGKCGHLNCLPPNSDECYRKIAREYRFYLSFENSICRDYVTEKLFKILDYHLIPIVFGGANYSAFMPHHSYIDATEMKPVELAALLQKLDNDPNEYLKYFEWKENFGTDEDSTNYNEVLFCKLCQKMEVQQRRSTRSRSSSSLTAKAINNWYFENSCNLRQLQFL